MDLGDVKRLVYYLHVKQEIEDPYEIKHKVNLFFKRNKEVPEIETEAIKEYIADFSKTLKKNKKSV